MKRTIASDEYEAIRAHSCEFKVDMSDSVKEPFRPCYRVGLSVHPLDAFSRGCHLEIWTGKMKGLWCGSKVAKYVQACAERGRRVTTRMTLR